MSYCSAKVINLFFAQNKKNFNYPVVFYSSFYSHDSKALGSNDNLYCINQRNEAFKHSNF